MTVQIPLLDAIKEVPIYTKAIKEACIKKLQRKKKDLKTIHFLGKEVRSTSLEPYTGKGFVLI